MAQPRTSWRWGLAWLALSAGCGTGQQSDKLAGPATTEAVQQAAHTLGAGLRKIREGLDDAELAGKVYARILWDKQLSQAKVSIGTKAGGIVEVQATVADETSRQRLLEMVATTIGVSQVIDQTQLAGANPQTTFPAAENVSDRNRNRASNNGGLADELPLLTR